VINCSEVRSRILTAHFQIVGCHWRLWCHLQPMHLNESLQMKSSNESFRQREVGNRNRAIKGPARNTGPDAEKQRFIPAHAGDTTWSCENQRQARVHPHACREQTTAVSAALRTAGSFPRTRAMKAHESCDPLTGWIIPAHAVVIREVDRECSTLRLIPDHVRAWHG
jgi:hypothetical protein